MADAEIAQTATQFANDALVWVGFGTVAGLLAKAIMPGRDPGGTVATISVGIGGSVIGCGVLAYFWPSLRVSPLTPAGFVVATGGAFLLLFFYRLLGGYFFREDGMGYPPHYRRRRVRRRATVYED